MFDYDTISVWVMLGFYIVIFGILITIALNVINPARIQRRAREAAMRAQTSRMCAATIKLCILLIARELKIPSMMLMS